MISGCAYHHQRTHGDLIRYGIELAQKGYWTEAAVQWRLVLEEDPTNAAALNNLGVAAEIDSHPEEARALLYTALKERPEDKHIRQNLASVKDRENQEATRDSDEETGENTDPETGENTGRETGQGTGEATDPENNEETDDAANHQS